MMSEIKVLRFYHYKYIPKYKALKIFTTDSFQGCIYSIKYIYVPIPFTYFYIYCSFNFIVTFIYIRMKRITVANTKSFSSQKIIDHLHVVYVITGTS